MSKVTVDSEVIAEVRNALTIIGIAIETVDYHYPAKTENDLVIARGQVKRIDKLLPKVKFEGGK